MPRGRERPLCSVAGCGELHVAKGFCSKHYRQANPTAEYQREWKARNRERARAYQREWYRRNRETEIQRATERHVMKRYGLTMPEYNSLLAEGCAICGTHEGKLCMDHNHANGKVRAALCSQCNLGIGALGDDPERMRRAADYVEEHDDGSVQPRAEREHEPDLQMELQQFGA